MAAEPRVAIVGAGAAGLACAAALDGAVVIDRVPVPGGVLGDRFPGVDALVADARAAGARLLLGRTALRFRPGALLVAGPGAIEEVAADVLVLAQGHRPRGRAESGLDGARPAGVLPAPVACHLIEAGLLPGRRPVVIGGGDWALRAVALLVEHGATTVDLVAPGGLHGDLPEGPVRVRDGLVPRTIVGDLRVTGLRCRDGADGEQLLSCDALVLADGVVPVRNVDGSAVGAPGVVAVAAPGDASTIAEAVAAGRAAAAEALSLAAG